VFVDHGCELKLETWAECIGAGASTFDVYAHLASAAARTVDVESVRRRRRPRHAALIAAQAILPGVREWIEDSRRLGLKLGVASSSTSEWVSGHLERLGLAGYFQCLKCADHVSKTKPDPELYVCVLDALGLGANESVAVEDSPNGVRAAKAAGLFCVAVPNALTRSLDLSEADLQLMSLKDMCPAELLSRLKQ